MYLQNKIGAVIVAAGSGLRFGERKQFKKLGSKPLYLHSLQQFSGCNMIDEIVLVVPKDLLNTVSSEITNLNSKIKIVEGGKLRQDSVLAGVNKLSTNCNIACIHDAARPFVSIELIQETINACKKHDCAIAAIPSSDTVKEVDDNLQIYKTLPRKNIWLAQTPQVFNRDKLVTALNYAKDNDIQATDEATLMEELNHSVVVVNGDTENFKITTPNDWKFAEIILEKYND